METRRAIDSLNQEHTSRIQGTPAASKAFLQRTTSFTRRAAARNLAVGVTAKSDGGSAGTASETQTAVLDDADTGYASVLRLIDCEGKGLPGKLSRSMSSCVTVVDADSYSAGDTAEEAWISGPRGSRAAVTAVESPTRDVAMDVGADGTLADSRSCQGWW